jgi:hypothetical protein
MTSRLFFVAALTFGWCASAQQQPPSTQETLQPKIEAIQKEIDRRRQNNSKAADLLEADLKRVQGLLAGKLRPPAEQPELHVIGFYEPAHWRTKVIIEVTEVGRPVILALCGYEPVRWHIKLARGAKVERVLLGGYHEQKLTWDDPEIGERVPTEQHTHENRSPIRFMAYRKDTADFTDLRKAMKQLTKVDIASFQGSYKGEEGPYCVGPSNPAWVAEIIEKEIEPLYREATALARAAAGADQTFKAVYINPNPPPRIMANGREMPPLPVELTPGALADFTLNGPVKETIWQLPDRARVTDVADDGGKNLYGITNHEVVQIDPKLNTIAVIKFAGDIPALSWTCGVAFDKKRNRLVVATLGGAGDLVAYDLGKQEWSYINGLNNIDLGALAYCPQEDCYYGIGMAPGPDHDRSTLFTFAPDGARTASVVIDEILVPNPRPDGGIQMAMMGRNIAIVTAPTRGNGARGVPAESGRCLLLDSKTGKVILSRGIGEHAAPAVDFHAEEVDRLWRTLGSSNAEQADQAEQRLISGRSNAVDALAPRVTNQPLTADRVNELIQLTGSPDPNIRERATSDLIQAGPPIVPQLRTAAELRLPAEATMRLAAVVDELTHTKERNVPEAQTRRDSRVVRVLYEIGSANAVEALIKLSASDSPAANEAREALRKI